MLDPELVDMSRPPWRQGAGAYSFYRSRATVLSPSPQGSPMGGAPEYELDGHDEALIQRILSESMAVQQQAASPDGEMSKAGGEEGESYAGEPPSAAEQSPVEPEPELVKSIVEMGFDEEMAKEYLAKTGNDV